MLPVYAQESEEQSGEDVFELDPFTVEGDTVGYMARRTLAGTRLNTDLEDVASAISVVTEQFLDDVGATGNDSLLQYTPAAEAGGVRGNFANVSGGTTSDERSNLMRPHQSTRIRGLAAADNTLNYFISDIPWDSYNVSRIDIQRGPNSILFGLGSPAGIINATTKEAGFFEENEIGYRYGEHGSHRFTGDFNRVLIKDQLAVRVSLLSSDTKYQQHPAYVKDERAYIAGRYDPSFLNSDSTSTVIRFKSEYGNINRNTPRAMPPTDLITPWFDQMNQKTYDPRTTEEMDSKTPGNGARVPYYSDGSPNPYYDPWLGNFAQVYGGIMAIFPDTDSGEMGRLIQSEPLKEFGIGPNGQIDRGISGIWPQRLTGVALYKDYAFNVGLPNVSLGQYKNFHLKDPSVYNFYNNLLDGPNKHEWADFITYNISLSQTFLDNRIGYELVVDRQDYDDGQVSFLTDHRQALNIDINEFLLDGTPNPNLGRPYISDPEEFGNDRNQSERENFRATAFFRHDFRDNKFGEGLFGKLLGRHTFTGMYSTEDISRGTDGFRRISSTDEYGQLIGVNDAGGGRNERQFNYVIYMGPSLLGRTSASGSNIPGIKHVANYPSTSDITFFDSHWNGAGVDPAAEWINPVNGSISTQSENPVNYIGWTTSPFTFLSNPLGMDQSMLRNARRTKNEIESKAFVWQGHFWDGAIVALYGYREDEAKAWQANAPQANGRAIMDGFVGVQGDPDNIVSGDSSSYSVVAHLDKFVKMPFLMSVFYNNSENFQPAANRRDVQGNLLPPPSGETKEYGIALGTDDNRFSLRFNKFETAVNNASNPALNSVIWRLGYLEQWAMAAVENFTRPEDAGPSWRVRYVPMGGQTWDEAQAQRVAATDAYLANYPPQQFLDFWNISTDPEMLFERQYTIQFPEGMTATSDTLSEGYEVEFTAQPTNNWRITANAARVESKRDNVGGAVSGWVDQRWELAQGPMGDLRMWWGGDNRTYFTEMQQNFMGEYSLMLLQEGSAVPELRKWRVNVVSTYNFSDGRLKGFYIGGGFRWEDENIIGYPVLNGALDLDNPYRGAAQSNYDGWLGYSTKIGKNKNIDWRIQLNVQNIGVGNEWIPISTQPDGTPAAVRIRPGQSWQVTNTFRF